MNSQYYLIFKNNACTTSLPEGVHYANKQLVINTAEKIEIEIVYELENDLSIEIILHDDANVDLLETRTLLKPVNFYKKVLVGRNAQLHTFLNHDSNVEVNLNEDYYVYGDASVTSGYAELINQSTNAKYHYYLEEENASAYVRMAIVSKEKENKKYEILIKHNAPHTTGIMDNYGVVKDEGKLTIDGIGTITKGQHQSESHQTNKIMVFDPKCVASANPYLYIDEYDVKASHAAGVGKMDEEHLYYLQSRGLTKKQAMQLITYGYLKPVIDVVKNEYIKEQFENVLSKVGE